MLTTQVQSLEVAHTVTKDSSLNQQSRSDYNVEWSWVHVYAYYMYMQVISLYCVHGACMEIPVLCMVHAWSTPVPHMEYTSATHEIHVCLYHTWNNACIMNETCISHAPVSCAFHAWNAGINPCMQHAWYLPVKCPKSLHGNACFRNHAWFMHEIANSSILSLEISCIKITGFSCMKCAETW